MMTIEELGEKGFEFLVSHYGYKVTLHWTSAHTRIVIADEWSHYPDSITALTERARRAAITYLVTQRLST